MDLLPDVLIKHCFAFLGQGHHVLVAGTCRRFRQHYVHDFPKKTTYWESAAASVSLVRFFDDNSGLYARLEQQAVLKILQQAAAKTGNLQVLDWIYQRHQRRLGFVGFAAAAAGGHLDVLEWGKSHGMDWFSNDLCCFVAMNGHLPVLEWIRRCRNIENFIIGMAYNAALEGHTTILHWMMQQNLISREDETPWEAKHGQLDVLQWLQNHNFTSATIGAFSRGSSRRSHSCS